MTDAGQQPAARIKGGNGVLERRRVGLGRESFYFAVVLRERDFKRRREVLGADFAEGRKSVRCFSFLEQGILGIHSSHRWSGRNDTEGAPGPRTARPRHFGARRSTGIDSTQPRRMSHRAAGACRYTAFL